MPARVAGRFRTPTVPLVALLAACGLCAGGASTPIKASTALYTITDLGSLGGGTTWWGWESAAFAVNSAGDVVGTMSSPTDPNNMVPFVYSHGTLTAIRDVYGWATGINDTGQATGFVLLPSDPNVHAFLYQNGEFTDIGTLPGYSNQPYSLAYGINNAGTIVGDSNAEGMIYENGVMIGLKRRAARTAYAINDLGEVVGLLEPVAPTRKSDHGFLFSGNTLVDLGTLDGDPDSMLVPKAINARQQIVGYAWNASGSSQRAFMYDHGVMTDLGTLAGGYAAGMGINSHGHVVGSSDGSSFLYRDGVMIDLNQVIEKDASGIWPIVHDAYAINDRGQIVGNAYFGGSLRAFIMTPIQ